MRQKGNGNKKFHGAEHVELFIMVAITGSNWFRSEHHLKEQSDAQMIVSADARGYMTVEKKRKKARKKHHGADHVMLSFGGR